MSGHSKWKNIAHKKEKTDAQRAKIFTKLSREIIVAVREGGGDPNANARLKDCIAKARQSNVPSDNIKRVIERAAGAGSAENYESVQYEGYGPGGTAVIVEAMTDNRNRTAGEVRHSFDKFGGNLGAAGCVSWFFDQKGILAVDGEGKDEDELMMLALDAGASDFSAEDGVFEIETEPEAFSAVRDALEEQKIAFLSAEVEKVPQNWVTLTGEEDIKKMRRLLDTLEDNEDVQNVWHNWENEE
ncbi:MAG: YebC/PmpR family DNA-binding transcriptional regulator [Oscillospiraceae bacterium]|jgi:YebC/PmpR family DNA-binding regulatory protein|nr:YebC/PmpR family DNA-binding transcriptional regulator [Oscillospiraceae bacterium]